MYKMDEEINEFTKQYINLIYSVMLAKKIPVCDREMVANEVIEKYGLGKFHHDPTRSKMTTYLTAVVKRACQDYFKEKNREQKYFVHDDVTGEAVMDPHADRTDIGEEIAMLVIEGLCRLSASTTDPNKVSMFVDYIQSKGEITLQTIQEIAKEYQETCTYVSMNCSSRLMPKFQQIMVKVIADETAGKLRLSDWNTIQYLAGKFKFSTNIYERILLFQKMEAEGGRLNAQAA